MSRNCTLECLLTLACQYHGDSKYSIYSSIYLQLAQIFFRYMLLQDVLIIQTRLIEPFSLSDTLTNNLDVCLGL